MLYTSNTQTRTRKSKGKGKGKAKLNIASSMPHDDSLKDPPAAFSQEYFHEIGSPATEDAVHPDWTNLAKKAACLQELRKMMNDVSCSLCVAEMQKLKFSIRAPPLAQDMLWT